MAPQVIGTREILLQQIVFLATASDSEIHPVAIAQLEAVVHGIRELPSPEREAFNAALRARISVAVGDELGALHELEGMLVK